jgi:hypothetical protein
VPPRPAGASSLRIFHTAIVLVTTPALDADTVTRATNLTAAIRDLFPSHWKAATRGLSIIDFAPLDVVADDGTVIDGAGNLDPTAGAVLFYRTHTNDYDFITFLHVASVCCNGHRTYQVEMTGLGNDSAVGAASYSGLPAGPPAGATRLLGVNSILLWPDMLGYAASNWMPVMLHEFHHQWCCATLAPPGYGIDNYDLADGHWKTRLFVPTRPKYPIIGGNTASGGWTDNRDGTYTLECFGPDATSPGIYQFPSYALYLMGLLSADEAEGVSFLSSSYPIPDCRSSAPLRVPGTPTPISLADLISFNGYAAQVTPPAGPISPVAGRQAEAYANAPPLTLAVGETRWVWVALRNTGTEVLGGSQDSFVVGEASSFAAGLDSVGWPDATVAARLVWGASPGEVQAVGFRVRGRTAGTYKLWLRTRELGGTYLNASWVLVFTVV